MASPEANQAQLQEKRDALVRMLDDLSETAKRDMKVVAGMLGLKPGDTFIPFNRRTDQPYCVRLLTADSKKNLVAYGVVVMDDGEVMLLVAEAFGSNWKTVDTRSMTEWHTGPNGRFRFNPNAARLHTLDDSKSLCIVELLVRLLRAKNGDEFLKFSGLKYEPARPSFFAPEFGGCLP